MSPTPLNTWWCIQGSGITGSNPHVDGYRNPECCWRLADATQTVKTHGLTSRAVRPQAGTLEPEAGKTPSLSRGGPDSQDLQRDRQVT